MRILLVGFDDCCALDLVGPADVFATANQLTGQALYEPVLTTQTPGPIVTESGVTLLAEYGLSARTLKAHTLLVGGGNGFRMAMKDPDLIASIRLVARTVDRVVSVCTGAFLLAEAGLLAGRRATTHWAYAAEMTAEFPDVEVVADELYVSDGDVTTAAGVAAGIDLALALVANDHGIDLARSVSHRMVVYLNRAGGQSQFSERLVARSDIDPALRRVIDGVVEEPAGDHSLAALAHRASMSPRHFCRVFRTATGTTPARWVSRVRVDTARTLLQTTELSPVQIASTSGFGSYHTMRQAFQRVLGLSPARCRDVN